MISNKDREACVGPSEREPCVSPASPVNGRQRPPTAEGTLTRQVCRGRQPLSSGQCSSRQTSSPLFPLPCILTTGPPSLGTQQGTKVRGILQGSSPTSPGLANTWSIRTPCPGCGPQNGQRGPYGAEPCGRDQPQARCPFTSCRDSSAPTGGERGQRREAHGPRGAQAPARKRRRPRDLTP